MARRPNYGYQKRQKELKRQQKKDEKAERKRLRKEEGTEDAPSLPQSGDGTDVSVEADAPDDE